jgi:hypothetical protein
MLRLERCRKDEVVGDACRHIVAAGWGNLRCGCEKTLILDHLFFDDHRFGYIFKSIRAFGH